MNHEAIIPYCERLRALLILYFFSEEYNNELELEFARTFQSEIKIRKLDFLIRYPNYVCYELLRDHEGFSSPTAVEAQAIIRSILITTNPSCKPTRCSASFSGHMKSWTTLLHGF